MIAYIYNRVSDDDQQTAGTSLESQSERNAAHAGALGYANVRQFTEVHTAAELWERPVLNSIREDIRARKVGALVCFAIDRLTRNVAHLMILQDECERHGCLLTFTTETLDNTPEGKLLASVRGYVAEVERLKIIERTVRGRRQRLHQGKINSDSLDLYGYRRDKAKGVRLICEDEADIVRSIFADVTSGKSLFNVMKRLNQSGVASPYAAKGIRQTAWSANTVRNIIIHPAYKGETIAWRYRQKKNGSNELRPSDEWIHLPVGVTPAIVTPDHWQRANDALSRNVGDKTRNLTRQYLLRGLIYCDICGRKAYPILKRGVRRYQCGAVVDYYRHRTPERCPAKLVPADECEADVWQQVSEAIIEPRSLAAYFHPGKSKNEPLEREAKSARRSIERLEQSEGRLLRRLRDVDDELSKLILTELSELQTELRTSRESLASIEERQQSQKRDASRLDETLRAMSDLLSKCTTGAEFEDKRGVLESVNLKVLANGEKWQIQINPLAGSDSDKNGLPFFLESHRDYLDGGSQ